MDDVVLRHVANRLLQRIEMAVQIEVVDEHMTAARRPHAVHRIHQSRFARAGRPQQADKFVWLNREADVVEQFDLAAA